MSAAFTPGPWQAIKGVEASDEMRCGVSAMRDGIGYLVATIENGAPGDSCDTEFSNARLIAAAPELYALAESLEWSAEVSHPEGGTEAGCPVCDAAKRWNHVPGCALAAALAEARGEQS